MNLLNANNQSKAPLLTSLLSLVFVLFSTSTNAAISCKQGGGDPCSPQKVASTNASGKTTSQSKNPIDVITGNKFQRESDYKTTGGTASLVLNRFYNSLNTHSDMGLGMGWSHSFDVRLKSSMDYQTMQIDQSDGRRIVFTIDPKTQIFHAVSPSDGYISRMGKRPMWVLNDGRRIIFRGMFPSKIIYPGERSFTLAYKGKGNNKTLSKVTDHNGRTLTFHYTQGNMSLARFNQEESNSIKLAGHLESVILPNGDMIGYHYDTEHNLSKVSYPDGTSRIYHYENLEFPNHLTGITDRTGKRLSTYGYTDEGRANLSTHAGGVDKITVEYKIPPQAGKLGTTVVTNSLGQKNTYTWKFYPKISQNLLISSEGPSCTHCPISNKQYTYNHYYQIETATDTKTGTVTRYAYDKLGRTTKITTTPKGEKEQLIARYEYKGNNTRPALIARPSINPNGEHITEISYNDEQLPIAITESIKSKQIRTVNLDYEHGKITRIKTTQEAQEETFSFQYDNAGYLRYRQLPTGPVLHIEARNKAGNPTEVKLKQFKQGKLINYHLAYDWEGNVTEVSQGNRKVIFEYFTDNKDSVKTTQIIIKPKKHKATIAQKLNMTFGMTAYAADLSKTVVKGVSGHEGIKTLVEFKAVAKTIREADSASPQTYLSAKYQKSPITITPNPGSVCPVTPGVTCQQLKTWHKYADLSSCVYEPATCSGIGNGQWQQLSASQLGIPPDLLEIKDGYYAMVTQNKITGEIVVSFRGTGAELDDIYTDLAQGLGYKTKQYDKAIELARQLTKLYPNKHITVTGHSLGGGLATAFALKMRTDAITFNAAGLHPKVAQDNGLSVAYANASNYITNVTVDGEILTTLQESGSIRLPGTPGIPGTNIGIYIDPPEAPGNHIVLPATGKTLSQYPGSGAYNFTIAVNRHRMKSVIASIEAQQKQLNCP